MRRVIIVAAIVLAATTVNAQQTQGTITYERIQKMQIRIAGMEGMENQLPKTRTDHFELIFANNQSVWKAIPEDDDGTEEVRGMGNGVQIRTFAGGSDDVLYTNFSTGKRVEKRELFEKIFVIDDTISKSLKWKMTGETKNILDLPCMKATTVSIRTRLVTNFNDGKMERKEIQDTSTIVAWFTSSIPLSTGPAEFQGQLPGLVLEVDVKDGTQIFRATGISAKADVAAIKEPTGKKRLTPDEFKKEREKLLEEMQKNNQGGQRIIRMN